MLHMRIYSNFVCLSLLLLVCAIRSLRITKRNSRHYCNSDGCFFVSTVILLFGVAASLAFPLSLLYHHSRIISSNFTQQNHPKTLASRRVVFATQLILVNPPCGAVVPFIYNCTLIPEWQPLSAVRFLPSV